MLQKDSKKNRFTGILPHVSDSKDERLRKISRIRNFQRNKRLKRGPAR